MSLLHQRYHIKVAFKMHRFYAFVSEKVSGFAILAEFGFFC